MYVTQTYGNSFQIYLQKYIMASHLKLLLYAPLKFRPCLRTLQGVQNTWVQVNFNSYPVLSEHCRGTLASQVQHVSGRKQKKSK